MCVGKNNKYLLYSAYTQANKNLQLVEARYTCVGSRPLTKYDAFDKVMAQRWGKCLKPDTKWY